MLRTGLLALLLDLLGARRLLRPSPMGEGPIRDPSAVANGSDRFGACGSGRGRDGPFSGDESTLDRSTGLF